jgi:DNA polymerase-3 subunit delta'
MNPKEELRSIVNSARIPNSLLFQGPDGSGKLQAAIEFASNVLNIGAQNTTNIIENISHPDLHIIFPIPSSEKKKENSCDLYINEWRDFVLQNKFNVTTKDWVDKLETKKQPQISIQIVSELSKKLSLSSFASGYKVILFWMADRLNEEASNKLLKLVEEPGNKTVFVFIIDKNKSLLKTLESRCQKISFKKPNTNEFVNNDGHEKIFSELTRNAFLARTNKESLSKLTEWSQNTSKLEREEIKSFLMYSNSIFRQAFMKNIGLDQYVTFQSSSNFNFEGFSKYINANNIESINNLVEDCHYNIKRNANSKMVMTSLAFELTKLIHT